MRDLNSDLLCCLITRPSIPLCGSVEQAFNYRKSCVLVDPVLLQDTDFYDRLLVEIQSCFPSTIELVLNKLDLLCKLTCALLQRHLEAITLFGFIIQHFEVVLADWMLGVITLLSQFNTRFLDEEVLEVHNRLSSKS
jgi:hypothetical protein